MASLTPGFSGADISSICNEAAINAVRRGVDKVGFLDFEIAIERIIGGIEKKTELSSSE
jgi:AFG3 family protein